MAFTNTPSESTYRTTRIKFDGLPIYRSGSLAIQRDVNIKNMYYDRISQENKTQEVFLKKRPGFVSTTYSLSKTVNTAPLRGSFTDIPTNTFYWAVGNKVYSISPDIGISIRTICTLATTAGHVDFSEFLQATTNTRFILITDGTNLWVDNYIALSCVSVTDPDIPTPHVPSVVVLDGYVFLAKLNTGDLYNSDNDDPMVWTAGNFISTEMHGDFITKLALNRNYIITFGTNTIEMFWNAAETPGPLKRYEAGYKNVGYLTGTCQIDNIIYFVGQAVNKNISVYMIDGLKLTEISNEVVNRTLQPTGITLNTKSNLILDRDGYALSIDGHTFYVLVTAQTTWVYDIEEKFWYEFLNSSNTALSIEAVWQMSNGAPYIALTNNTTISMMSPQVYDDLGVSFSTSYTTERIDIDSNNLKTANKVTILSDIYQTTGESLLTLTWSNDDWTNTSGTRTINLFTASAKTYRLGQFRTRSYRLTYTDNYPLRIRAIELENNIGTH